MSIDTAHIKPGMTGEIVTRLHHQLVLAGFAIPVDELQDDRYGAGTEAAIRKFQAANAMPTVDGHIDAMTASALGLGATPAGIAGIVARRDGTSLPNIAVELYQEISGKQKVIGQTRSAADGKFELAWPSGLRSGLMIRAEGSAARSVPWRATLNTGPVWMRLSVGGEYRGPTKFAALAQALAPAAETTTFHLLGGAGRAPELATLQETVRAPAKDIARFLLAHKLAAKTELDPRIWFAVLAHGIAPETMTALTTSSGDAEALDDAHVDQLLDVALWRHEDELRGAVTAAVAHNLIAEVEPVDAAAQLNELRIAHIARKPLLWMTPVLTDDAHACCRSAIASPANVADPLHAATTLQAHDAPLRDVVATVLAEPAAQRAVFESFAARGSHAPLHEIVDHAAGLSTTQRDDLRFTLEAATLLDNHLPLVAHAQQLRAAGRIASTRDLARLDAADWAAALRGAAPNAAHIAEAHAEGGLAHALARRFEQRYPTTALAGRLAKAPAALPLQHGDSVAQFLDRAPDFCVRHSHIDRFVRDHGAETLPVDADHPAVIEDLKALQRTYKLTTRFDHVQALLADGHRSAYAIHALGPEQFAAQLTARGATPEEAQDIFARAEQMYATTLTLMANLNSETRSETPLAVAPRTDLAAVTTALGDFPTIQSLFSAGEYCACADCRSVHGPAAYFVDILELLKARLATDNATSARTLAFKRRPDLQFIELSCANTNGVVPYIDLVCEVLEDAVGALPTDDSMKARQTAGTVEERRANPAFVRETAYTALLGAKFPITAPFDLFVAEVRAYLRQLGVRRHELMTAFQTSAAPTDAEIAGETFGFNAGALNIVTTASPANPWTLWGLQQNGNSIPDPRKPDDATAIRTGTNLQIMAFVPILLHRAKLSHRELVQILETRFVNTNKVLAIVETGVTIGPLTNVAICDSGLQSVTGWTDDLLTRFNRFIRLWRQLGCTIWDLDKALATPKIANGVLDDAAMVQLAKVDAIAKRLELPWDELLTLWGPLDTVNYINVLDTDEPTVSSVYKRRFRNPAVTQAATVFTDDPGALSGNLDNADVQAGISAALDLSAADLKRIRAAVPSLTTTGGTAPPLDLANLSILARYATLARGLKISIADLLVAIAVTGVDPFPSDANQLTPALTQQFLAAFEAAQRSAFSLRELDYLLRHGSVLDSGLALPDATIASWVDQIRKELVRQNPSSAAARTALVGQQIAAVMALDDTLTQQVLQATLPGASQTIAALFAASELIARNGDGTFATAATRASFAGIFDALTAIDKMKTVLARWKVSTVDALWLLQHASAAGWMALHVLPGHAGATTPATLSTLDTLRQNVVVQQTLASASGARLFDIVLAAGASTLAAAITSIAQLGGWLDADLSALATRFGWTMPAQLVAGTTVARIRDLMAWPRKLGTDVATTLLFVPMALGASEARKARQLAKSWFSNDEWLGASAAIQNVLREQKRAALVDYLLANPQAAREQKWSTVDDLYGYFLIDPEMSPVAETTRIKQAAASLQLYIQRCFLQLEAINVDSDSVWKQWDWMKRFRLWEANRKIFLYPENWYDPSQRRDTSPYFQELVEQLQQGELTNEIAEDALRAYLHKLVDVAHLEISGVWEEPVTNNPSILHVVARTRKAPYAYSYRRRESSGSWSAWEPIDAAANANHVMPVIWNKRLFMLWTDFVERALPGDDDDRRVPVPPTNPTSTLAPDAHKYWEITLSWIERRGDAWLPKRQSQRKQLIDGTAGSVPVLKRQVAFRTRTPVRSGSSLQNLVVSIYEPNGASTQALGQWLLTSSQDEPLVFNADRDTLAAAEDMAYIAAMPPGTPQIGTRPTFGVTVGGEPAPMSYHFNAFGGDNPDKTGVLSLQRPVAGVPTVPLLSTMTMARVLSARYGDSDQFSSPFFVSDAQRTFFSRFESSAWKLQTFYHPFAEVFVQQLNQGGIAGLYDRAVQVNPDALRGMAQSFNFATTYSPNTNTAIVATPYPTEAIDYTPSGPYAIYNWELFLHTPLLIAQRLADNQRFDEALRWLHYIFNPHTVNDPSQTTPGAAPARYWNPKIFRDLTKPDYQAQSIEQLLALLTQHNTELEQRVADWRNHPFDPNMVALARPVAYQKAVVIAYISTLIAWGDQLFRSDTVESINEATQLYLLANQLLGPRPQALRAVQPKQNKNYKDLGENLDKFSNVMVDIENIVSVPPPATGGTAPTPTPLHTFYFCIPPNDQMLKYWDTVADRLFKIRHGMNFEGTARPLAIFDPPIDPGLLTRATAAGIDIAAVLADAAVGVGCYRFATLWQAAHDLCQDVRGLGNAILGAYERQDAEEMARLRATQEVAVNNAVREVKAKQLDEAKANKAALESTKAMAKLRYEFYTSRDFMNAAEVASQSLNSDALDNEEDALSHDQMAIYYAFVPNFSAGIAGFGGSPTLSASFGGDNLGRYESSEAGKLRGDASVASRKASQSATLASYQRRRDDWKLQADLANAEVAQLDNQLTAAELRIAFAERELAVQDLQVASALDNAELLRTKFSNQELYRWTLTQLSATYFQAYQLAYDLARRASKAYAFELGREEPGFIQFGYWDSLHRGLIAGDKLLLDLRRLQAEHLQNNKRELELTRHVSLLQLDPQALVRLRETGACDVLLHEKLFDQDQPGHYYRRLKSMSVTLPCVTGPYTSVNARLSLTSHAIRTSTSLTGGYASTTADSHGVPSESARFAYVPTDGENIALSTGREDAGMFEVSLRDERYLPFEGAGAISYWHLELPQQDNQFDISTLSDVILHLRYTARDGGSALRTAARTSASTIPPTRERVQLLSARTELPDAYARLFAPTGAGQRLDVVLTSQHFPFIPASQKITITGIAAAITLTNDQHYDAYGALAPAQRLTARVGITPSDGTVPTTSKPFAPSAAGTAFDKVPTTELVTLSGATGPLTIAFIEAELASQTTVLVQPGTLPDGTAVHRLIRDRIDDVLLLVRYQVSAQT